tara:strand:+ start:956 stop:2110 length:1155 start_codon:yes stop_codon:yes gene_type:complete
MAYNPGISYRGEMLGQAIGQAGQSLAQSYGQGLRLKEEKDRYDKEQKQKKQDRKNLKKSYEMQAGIIARGMPELGIDEDDISTMGLGELQGFVEGTKLSQQMEYQGLQLEKIQDDLNQTKAGKNAMMHYADMLNQGLPPQDAAEFAINNVPDLGLANSAKLLQLAGMGDELEYKKDLLGLQSARNQTAQRTVDYQESELKFRKQEAAEEKNRKNKPPVATPVEGLPGAAVVNVGGRDQLVTSADTNDPQEAINRRNAEVSLNEKISTAYEEADQIATGGGEDLEGGDERTIFLGNRYTRLGKFFSDLRKDATTYKQKYGKDIMPDFYDSVVPLVNHMRNQNRDSNDLKKLFQSIGLKTTLQQMKAEGNEKGAKKLAEKFGIEYR